MEPIRFGMSMANAQALAAAGAKPDLGTFWVGPWTLSSGWGDPDRKLDQARAANITPVIQYYYWGDDISISCVENGCLSRLHDAVKDQAGWQLLAEQLVAHLNARLNGRPAIIVVETEFNKGDIATYEPFDGYLEAKARYLKQGYPAAQVILGFGNWGSDHWATFDRAAAASDGVGIQAMRGSTRDSRASYLGLVDSLLQGAKLLQAKFAKPVLVTDVAASTYPEPEYLEDQRAVVAGLFSQMGDLRAAGVFGVVYRDLLDNPSFDTANYFGEAERHWGLAYADGTPKPSLQAWLDGVSAQRDPAPSPAVPPPPDLGRQEAESFATRTTGGRVTDASASAGAAWNLWANGRIEHRLRADAAGTHEVRVLARGDELGGVAPHMVVSVDGLKVFEANPRAGAYQTFTGRTPLAAGDHNVRIEFTNDARTSTGDRNLIVDVVSLRALQRVEAEAFATRSTGARQAEAGASGGAIWNLWANGYVAQSLAAPTSGDHELRVRARGQLLDGVAPHMVVRLDGARILDADPGTSARDFVVPLPSLVQGPHNLRIEFTNDAVGPVGDRNLLLDYVELARAA